MVFDFPREEILASIRSNQERHLEQLAEALDAWRGEFTEALEAEIARLTELHQQAKSGELRPRDMPHDQLGVQSPQSHERDYEVAIRMLEMASTESVALAETDFARFVLDQWDWRDRFDDYLNEMRFKRRGTARRQARRA